MAAVRIVVRGRVQGVGFRAFVEALARARDVKGEVWNRRDGAVEAVAQHSDEAVLAEFVDRVGRGPGRVEAVEVEDLSSNRGFTDFRIVWRP